jgi:hypothetical protein
LKHPDAILATYKRRQMKHLKHASETSAKTCEKHLKTIATHTQHPDKHTCNIRLKKKVGTLETDACNIRVQTIATYATTPSTFATSI